MTGDDPLAALENQLQESQGLFSAISEEKSLHRYPPDKWSIRQMLNHVTDSERAFAFRALSFARGLESPLPSYDQNVAASSAEADQVSWAAHVEEFQRVRLSYHLTFPEHALLSMGAQRHRQRQSLHRAGLHHPMRKRYL